MAGALAGSLALAAGALALAIGAPPACEAATALNDRAAKADRIRVETSLFTRKPFSGGTYPKRARLTAG